MGDNDWDTVTKIGFKTGSTRQTTVKGSAAINAAARTGSLSSEKKFTGTKPPSQTTPFSRPSSEEEWLSHFWAGFYWDLTDVWCSWY
jgi:hypothetical protein